MTPRSLVRPRPLRSRNMNGNLFEQAGFTRANTEVKRRLIMGVDGGEKSGKSHFALSAPPPIAVINFDIGLDGVVQKWQDDKDIWVQDIRFVISDFRQMQPQEAAKAADEILIQIKRAVSAVMGEARTIVTDNATELWELVRLSHFGKLEQVKSHHYVHPNNEYREFIRQFYDQATTNLLLLHKTKDEYLPDSKGDGQRTGNRIRAGFADTGFLVQCNAVCYRDTTEPKVPDCFHLTVIDCRQNAELAGLDLSGHDLNFSNLAMQVFPKTKMEDWL